MASPNLTPSTRRARPKSRRKSSAMTIRVLLADDQALLRATFRLLVDSAPDTEVVGEAPNGREAVRLAHSEAPDIVLMDIRMPEMDGIEATQQNTNGDDRRAVKIIILTTFETEDLVVSAMRAGASAYLGKGVEPANLLAAVRTVAAGESLLNPSATLALISRMLAQPNFEPSTQRPCLTSSPPGSVKSCCWSHEGSPTPKSPNGSSSPR